MTWPPAGGSALLPPFPGDCPMNRLVFGAMALALFALVGAVYAEDKKDAKDGLTGTWKWSVEVNGQKRETTLKLKQEGDKLSGAVLGRNNTETKIEDATIKDGKVSFTVTRERNGNKIVQKFSGKLEGDTLKLKIEREGQEAREVEAKRAAD